MDAPPPLAATYFKPVHILSNTTLYLTQVSHSGRPPSDPSSMELQPFNAADLIREEGATSSALTNKEPSTTHEIDEPLIPHDDVEFPEGGLGAYAALFGCFMGFVPAFGLMNVIGVIESYVSSHQLVHVSSSTVSWIFSMYFFVAFFFGIFSGTLFDRGGSRKPLIIGSVGLCGGLLATAECTQVYQFILAFGVLTAIGNGMMMAPLMGVVSHYFSRKRGMATSIATNGGSVGGVVIPLMLRKLYVQVGFKWALRSLALFFAICCLISIVLAKERFRQQDKSVTGVKSFFQTYVLDCLDYKSLYNKPNFLFCTLAITAAEMAVFVISLYLPSYATSHGNSQESALLLVTIMNACACFGRYIPGLISDYLGRFNVMICAVSTCIILCLALWMPFGSNVKVLYAFVVLYGFFSGCIQALPPVCTGQISRTEEFGKRYSTVYFIVATGMLGGVPVAGALVGQGQEANYRNLIIFASLTYFVSLSCFLTCRTITVGWKLSKF